MDSLTHILLGAAIGDKMLGQKIGRKAALIGALAKTFPDFDVFFAGQSDPQKYLCVHRGYTHSMPVQVLMALPLAYICYLIFKKQINYKTWYLLWLLCMWGHSLLDTCTNYGTRLLLPFNSLPYSVNSIAIVDLFYTLPLLIALILAMLFKNNSTKRSNTITICLVYAMLYLGVTFINKTIVNYKFEKICKSQHIPYKNTITNPTILNNILWYGITSNDTAIYVGEYSLLQPKDTIRFYMYKRNLQLLDSFKTATDLPLMQWFSGPHYFLKQRGDTLDYYNIKFGRTNLQASTDAETFIFYYKLYQDSTKKWQLGWQEPSEKDIQFKPALIDLWQRMLGKKI